MAKVKISYELDLYEEKDLYRSLICAEEARRALYDVDQCLRSTIKRGNENWPDIEEAYEYLEKLREIIAESGALKDYV